MTMRVDAAANDAGDLVRREHARDLGAGVVVALYRLARLAQLHDLANQAFLRQLEQTHQSVGDYCLRAGTNVSVLFAHKSVFLAGELLKGSRATYEAAGELGDLLEWCGGSELSIARDVTQPELLAFAEAISVAMRGEKGRGLQLATTKIRLRAVGDAARVRGVELERLSIEQRIVRNYATAVVVLRRFFEDLSASRYVLPRRIKRIAQNLVDLSAGSTPAFLGVTEARNANHDAAGRAVNAAILAVAIARELTSEPATLAQIAMAAMMHDVGRPRAMALSGPGGPRLSQVAARLSEEAEDKLPGGTAAVLTALGRLHEPSMTRTVIAFETLWLRRISSLGPVYRGARPPTLHARIVALARRYNDLLTPEPGLAPPSQDLVVATLAATITDAADRTVLRMLVAALGLFPVGTVVQLSSGEVGEVVSSRRGAAPRGPRDERASKPTVRISMGPGGSVLGAPSDVDLARSGETRRVTRVMSIEGWRKGLDEAPARGTDADASSPSRSAVVPTEPRVPVAMPITTAPPPAARTDAGELAAVFSEVPPSPPAPAGPPPAPLPATVFPPARASATAAEVEESGAPSGVSEAMRKMIADALSLERVPPGPTSPPPEPLPSPVPPPPPPRPTSPVRAWRIGESSPPRAPDAVQADVSTFAEIRAARPVTPVPPPGAAHVPTARGTLGATPLVHVLVYMLDHALTGSIVLREPDELDHVLHFQIGAVSKVVTARPTSRIGDELVGTGVVTRATVNEAVDGARHLGLLLGEYLVGHDLVTRDALTKALETQISSRVASLVNLSPETSYSFYRDVDLLRSVESEGVVSDPINVILATVRAWDDRARIRATLSRIAKHPLVFQEQSDITHVALTADERRVLDHILAAKPATSVLFQARVADEETVSSLVYALAVTRQFSFKGQKGAPMGWREPTIPISIAPPAPVDVVNVRVPAASKAPSFSGSELEEALGRASAAPPRAGSRLPPAAPSARALGEVALAPSESNAERVLEAMTNFRLAESALQRNDLAQAERLAARAVSGDPEQKDYLALHAWVRAMTSANAEGPNEAILTLSRLLAEDAGNERALLYRGKLLKRMNRTREALRDFERVLQANPRHREAAQEARLLKQRATK